MRSSFVAALSIFLGVQGVTASSQRFSLSCNDLSLNGPTLQAKCNNKDGNPVPANIDLNTIISFEGGKLQWARNNAGFSTACPSCTLYRDFDPRETKYWGYPFQLRQAMKCACGDVEASIVLDQEIGNDNGRLYATLF